MTSILKGQACDQLLWSPGLAPGSNADWQKEEVTDNIEKIEKSLFVVLHKG